MAEPLLFVPGYGVSPRACDEVPALHAALESFREHFEVTTFHWPSVKGGRNVPPTWQAACEVMREALPAGGHVVAIRGNMTYALVALRGATVQVRSLVCDGYDVPPATWDALGMDATAVAAEASLRLDTKYQGLPSLFEGADPARAKEIGQRLVQDGNPEYSDRFIRQAVTLNLLEELSQIDLPALYLRRGSLYPGWTEPHYHELFLRFVPNTEFGDMEPWRYHDAAMGKGFAEKAIPFLQKHSGRTVLSTVLFADIVDSTVHAATMGDRRWSQVLSQFHGLVGLELKKSGGRLVDTAGDGFLAVFDDPGAAVGCARSVTEAVVELGLEARAGIHTGQVEVSDEKYSGIAVHTAARVAAKAGAGEVLVSETVRQLLAGSSAAFEKRGSHELKGLPERISLYAATSPQP